MGREAAFRDAQAAFDRDRQTGLAGLGQYAGLGANVEPLTYKAHSYLKVSVKHSLVRHKQG